FAAAPQHTYIARSIDPPQDVALPPDLTLIRARPPFDAGAEARLLAEQKIDVLVSKNSGSAETYGKIDAARALGLPVIMVERPGESGGAPRAGVGAAGPWLEGLRSAHGAGSPPASRRGV